MKARSKKVYIESSNGRLPKLKNSKFLNFFVKRFENQKNGQRETTSYGPTDVRQEQEKVQICVEGSYEQQEKESFIQFGEEIDEKEET